MKKENKKLLIAVLIYIAEIMLGFYCFQFSIFAGLIFIIISSQRYDTRVAKIGKEKEYENKKID